MDHRAPIQRLPSPRLGTGQVSRAGRGAAFASAAIGIIASLTLLPSPAAAQTHGGFTNVTRQAGLDHRQHNGPISADQPAQHATGGAAVGDFFNNGWLDIYFTRMDGPDILYRNMGDGTFTDVTTQVFGDRPIHAPTNGALFFDADNDGLLDLHVTTSGGTRHYFYLNDGNGRLIEQAYDWGLDHDSGINRNGMSATAGDYTSNGYLDLYVADWSEHEEAGAPNRLYRNSGAGYFDDVTEAAGVAVSHNQRGFTGRFADMDRDGNLDLLAVNDFAYSVHYESNGDGTFRTAFEYGTGTGFSEMGSTVADFTNTGYLDWFVTAIQGRGGNRLYVNQMHRNIPNVYFTEEAEVRGVDKGSWGWGASFIDYDNNGLRDIVMVNGFDDWVSPMRFWRNEGPDANFTFTEISEQLGLTDDGQGRGLIVADFFNNGFLDILVINHGDTPVLYRNEGNDNDWLRINVVGEESNSMGIGAWITIQPNLDEDLKLVHDVNLGNNYLGHNETTAHFGLGSLEKTVDYLHILWPSGIEQEFYDIQPNQLLTIHELDGIQSLSIVPEPTTAALLGLGLVMLLRRR